MSKRRRVDNSHLFSLTPDAESAVLMNTSIGSDGERSDNDFDTEDVTPSTTPISTDVNKGTKRKTNQFVYNLKFSIDNILKPEFGRPNGNGFPRGSGSDTSESPPAFGDTPSPVVSPTCGQSSVGIGRSATANSVNSGDPKPASAPSLWPAWVYCTRYSDRPSSGPRCRRMKREKVKQDEKRPRTAFTIEQLARLKGEFQENRYLTEKRRQDLARDLGLNESQIKIWFQNKRAKIKKQSGGRNMLALHLMAQGLYNHATIPVVMDDTMDKQDDEASEQDNSMN